MDESNSKNEIIKSTSGILETTYINLLKGLTGLATADKKELIFSASRILQNIRSTSLLGSLKKGMGLLARSRQNKRRLYFNRTTPKLFARTFRFLR